MNIIKQTCKDLNITYRELADAIGYSESTLRIVASQGKISDSLNKAIELYVKLEEARKRLEALERFKEEFRIFLKS